jgi:hypothetical protein
MIGGFLGLNTRMPQIFQKNEDAARSSRREFRREMCETNKRLKRNANNYETNERILK